MDDEAIAKPFIGVMSTHGENTPCSMSLRPQVGGFFDYGGTFNGLKNNEMMAMAGIGDWITGVLERDGAPVKSVVPKEGGTVEISFKVGMQVEPDHLALFVAVLGDDRTVGGQFHADEAARGIAVAAVGGIGRFADRGS